MSLQRLRPEGMAPPGGAYVHGILANGFVFVAGQVARAPDGRTVGVGDMEAQATQALENVRTVLAAAGCTLADVVRMTVYVTDMSQLDKVGAVRRRFFGDQVPASASIGVSCLANPDFLIEIEATALVPSRPTAMTEDEL